MKLGKSLTCKCISNLTSLPAVQIARFIRSLGPQFKTEFEHKVNGLAYDILVTNPTKNLLIEYDGAHWHEKKGSKEREIKKEKNAIDYGYEFLRIKEVEWKKENREKTKELLKVCLCSVNVSLLSVS